MDIQLTVTPVMRVESLKDITIWRDNPLNYFYHQVFVEQGRIRIILFIATEESQQILYTSLLNVNSDEILAPELKFKWQIHYYGHVCRHILGPVYQPNCGCYLHR